MRITIIGAGNMREQVELFRIAIQDQIGVASALTLHW